MLKKVLITAPILRFPDLVNKAKTLFEIKIIEYMPYEDLSNTINLYDGLLINARIKLDNQLIQKTHLLKAVFSPTIGFDHVDQVSLAKKGIQFSALGLENKFRSTLWSTAEHALTLILTAYRDIKHMSSDVENNFSWDNRKYFFNDIRNSTIGIIGFGNIGKKLYELLKPFNCNILVYDPYISTSEISQYDVSKTDLNSLLMASDIVTLHVPLNNETKYLIDFKEFLLMKSKSIIINTSRGGVVNELAFLKAIKENKINGGAFDVVENESPFGVSNSLLVQEARHNKKILITPHVGGSSQDYLHKVFSYSLDRLSEMLN
jgi:D-3-phosphoglycerate dehydrogenase / 2-oxoglutarate reductase